MASVSSSGEARCIPSGTSTTETKAWRSHRTSLPVPSLWLDVFQKIKAMGYNGVSFYSAWALHEPKPGHFSAEGVFDWEPFFDAAKKVGVYLIAVSSTSSLRIHYTLAGTSRADFSAPRAVHQRRGDRWWVPGLAAAHFRESTYT